MPTTLNSGLQLPDKGSVDWYSSMQNNYNLLDNHLENTNIHVTAEDKANWDSKQGSLSQAQLDAIAQVATNTSDIATLQSGKANTSHTHSSSDITDIGDYATKQYVDNSISGLVDNAPDALNTLNELSAALNDDSNFASTVTTALAAKANSADLATVATSGSYTDLTDKPTINDSTITIQKNGSTVDTFTTNGSAKTIDITVPTKTSDLTNDSNFVDTSNSAVASGITSAKVTSYDGHIANGDIHVTASDKAKWDTVALIKQLRLVNTQVGSATTIAFANIDDTNGIKVGDKCMDLDAKLFEITAVDTANQTVTVGTALIDLALDANVVHTSEINSSGIGIIEAVKEVGGVDFNTLTTQGLYGTNASGSTNNPENSPCVVQVIKRGNSVIQIASVSSSAYKSRYIRYCADITAQSPVWGSWIKFATDDNVMHLSGNETVSGEKVFGDVSTFDGSYIGNEASTNARTVAILESNRDTHGQSGLLLSKFRQYKAQGALSGNDVVYFTLDVLENGVRTNAVFRFNFRDFVNDIPQDIAFYPTGSKNSLGGSASGSSSNKWHLFNGLNPGALSLPDLDSAIDISGYITNFGTSTVNEYIPIADGWISIANSGDSPIFIRVYNDYGFEQIAYSERNELGGTTGGTYTRYGSIMIPCIKNIKIYIIVTPSTSVLVSAKFFPCQGNV